MEHSLAETPIGGRNVALFEAARQVARQVAGSGIFALSFTRRDVADLNKQFPEPLPWHEVKSVHKSVSKYFMNGGRAGIGEGLRRWNAEASPEQRSAAARRAGIKSGKARREACAERDWQAGQMVFAFGMTRGEAADALGVHRNTITHALRRLAERGITAETWADQFAEISENPEPVHNERNQDLKSRKKESPRRRISARITGKLIDSDADSEREAWEAFAVGLPPPEKRLDPKLREYIRERAKFMHNERRKGRRPSEASWREYRENTLH